MVFAWSFLPGHISCVSVNDLLIRYTRVEVREILTFIFSMFCLVLLFHEKNTDIIILEVYNNYCLDGETKLIAKDKTYFKYCIIYYRMAYSNNKTMRFKNMYGSYLIFL